MIDKFDLNMSSMTILHHINTITDNCSRHYICPVPGAVPCRGGVGGGAVPGPM